MLAPEYAYAYLGKADILERLGRHEEAITAYQRVVELDTVPNNESCAMYALLALNRQEDAVTFMDRVLDNIGDLVPPVAVFWYRRFTLSDFSYRLSGTAPESVL